LSAAPWLAIILVFVVALVLRYVLSANADIGWLLTAGERVLGGATLYRDVIETNPPIAVLAYIPAIVIARIVHLRPEVVVDGLVFAAAAVAWALAARILAGSAAMRGVRGAPVAILALAVLIVLPARQFGQREHIAVIALLPWLALAARWAGGDGTGLRLVVIAGLGAGIAMMFKPHFAVGIVFAAVALAIVTRSWRAMVAPENVVAGIVVVAYALAVAWLFPAFFSVIGPLVRDVYLPVGLAFSALMAKPAVAIWIALVLLTVLAMRRNGVAVPAVVILLAASCGFAVAFIVQGKGWTYHSYPMIALALVALGWMCAVRDMDFLVARIGPALLGLIFAGATLWFNSGFDALPLQARVARLGAHPAILAITAEPALGHPLVRALDGTWVSRQQGLWVAAYLAHMEKTGTMNPSRRRVLDVYAAQERAWLIADIRRTPPDIVLVDNLTGKWSDWLAAHADVAALLKNYRRLETVNGIDILRRAE
jgi:hypothetical protein